jgi:methylglutaconyl-CoA hydratase
VISPYVLRAIGPREGRRWFLTGERFKAAEARRIGLVHEVVPAAELGAAGDRMIEELLTSGPEAVRAAKRLIEEVTGKNPDEAMPVTVRTIAERRASAEAKEGLSAFLEKRAPAWAPKRPKS